MLRPSPVAHRPSKVSSVAITTLLFVAVATVPANADPRIDYILNCQGCHGPDGAGAPGAAPSFRDHVAKFLSVPGGREYLIRVPGVTQSELTDARTAAVLNWLVQEFSPQQVPADFKPYSEAEIAQHRQAPLTDVVAARAELLRAIDAGDGGNSGRK
ncbi:MAG: hypothetical protein HY270_22170 [Deltaproteobacteria bacterium]|nr:hypothetical protein [Deltaproteobacteria bacterium]